MKNKTSSAGFTPNKVYAIVTEKIIKQINAGTIPWLKPWKPSDAPHNISGRRYSGINPFLLEAAREEGEFESNIWMTFNQAMELGGDVKGQHTSMVIYASSFDKKPNEAGKVEKGFSLRYYHVFNADQVANITLPKVAPIPVVDPIKAADRVIKNMPQRPEIKHGGNRACYFPLRDNIQLPPRNSFKASELYYAVAFHELVHATAHESRLARQVGTHIFGSQDYSKEELVAEMGSAFLMGATGIETAQSTTTSAAYIQNWLQALANDVTLVVKAASAAQRAADFILGLDTVAARRSESVGEEVAA